MQEQVLLPHLFRTEYRKIVSVLCSLFGIDQIEIAEDIVSDTFLSATESWSLQGLPENPTAWLYAVAKNKTRNRLKRDALFEQQIAAVLRYTAGRSEELEIDLSQRNIADSQLAMIFTVCHPAIPPDAQVSLALSVLCGFGVQEIADAFLTNKEVVYKRLSRAKEKLKSEQIRVGQPTLAEIGSRLDQVLTTLYLLFSEGYYSVSQNKVLRKDFCEEAMRLATLLTDQEATNTPPVNALLSLMCFHASRFDARIDRNGESVLYEEQDDRLWDQDLIGKGVAYLNRSATGQELSRYHLEAGIAYWHTRKEDSIQKWENILQFYNQLLQIQYSPIAALNRTFALAKANGKAEAIVEAEKLQLTSNPFYFSLLGHLYTQVDNEKARKHFEMALQLSNSTVDKQRMAKYIAAL